MKAWRPSLSPGTTAPDGRFLMVEVKRGAGIVPPPPSDLRLIMNWAEQRAYSAPTR